MPIQFRSLCNAVYWHLIGSLAQTKQELKLARAQMKRKEPGAIWWTKNLHERFARETLILDYLKLNRKVEGL